MRTILKLIIDGKEYICEVIRFSIGDSVDNDLIIYNDETDKIIALNVTSTFIYRELERASEACENLSDIDIASSLSSIFDIDESLIEDVIRDIRDVLSQFISEGILKVNYDLLA